MKKMIIALMGLAGGMLLSLSFPNPAQTSLVRNPLPALPYLGAVVDPENQFILQKGFIRGLMEGTGTVVYRQSIRLTAPIAAEFLGCRTRPGERIHKGSPLILSESQTLKKSFQESALRSLESIKMYEHFLRFTLKEHRQMQAIALQRSLQELDDAEQKCRQSGILLERGLISRRDCQKATEDFKLKKMTHDLFLIQQEKERKAIQEQEQQLIKTIRLLEEESSQIKQMLDSLVIRSPLTGVVTEMSERIPSRWAGQEMISFAPGEWLLSVAEDQAKDVEVYLSEEEASKIKTGDRAELISPQIQSGSRSEARVMDKSPAPVPYGDQYRSLIRLHITRADKNLQPGEKVRCVFETGNKKDVWVIPLQFLFYQEGKKVCYLLRDGGWDSVEVETGLDDGERIEIDGDLHENQILVRPVLRQP